MPKPVNRPIPDRIAERAATRFTVDANGCWPTTYAVQKSGYASVAWGPRDAATGTTIHRAAWTYHHGKIPDDMTVHHKCYNTACVNPEHLALMTNADNARRQKGSDFPLGRCKIGHPDSDRKLYGKKKPVWRCGTCVKERNAAVTLRRKIELEAERAAA